MSFISYAQNFEDVMLWRALKHVEIGFYIDVGANDPRQDSVTKAFYDHGWHGINIEPISQWFEKLVIERPRDINLQVAAGARAGELQIYEFPDTGLSTLDRSIAERHEAERGYKKVELKVPVRTLTEICTDIHLAPIHFLKIDVEGAEKQVLDGVDFSIIRPWIVLVESTLPNSQIEDYAEWESILLNANYEFVYFDGLNRFYVAKEHPELKDSFRIPPNYFDGFVLGVTSSFCNLVLAQKKQKAEEVSAAINRIEHLTLQCDELKQTLVERESMISEQRAHVLHLQAEWDVVKTKMNELNESSHHWWTVADDLSRELQGVYKSKSWRITCPLRMIMKFIRRLLSFLMRVIHRLFFLPKLIVKRILRNAISYVLARPRLKAKGLVFLASRPKLKARLRSLAFNKDMLTYQSGPDATAYKAKSVLEGQQLNSDNCSELTCYAQRIYSNLIRKINEQQKEVN